MGQYFCRAINNLCLSWRSETFKRYQWEFVIWFTARRNSQAMAIVWWARPFSRGATHPWAKCRAPADVSIKVHEIFVKRRCKWINSHFSYTNEALLSIDSLVVFGCFTTPVHSWSVIHSQHKRSYIASNHVTSVTAHITNSITVSPAQTGFSIVSARYPPSLTYRKKKILKSV